MPKRDVREKKAPMANLRIELQLPKTFWLSRLTLAFPESTFWVVALQRSSSGAVIAQVSGHDLPLSDVERALERDPDIDEFNVLERGTDDTLIRIDYRRPALVPVLEETGLLPRYPFAARSGVAYWEVLGAGRLSKKLVHELEERFPGSQVRKVSSATTYDPASRLTRRQDEVLHKALELGYYDFPRRITLTKLAKELRVDKGSLSVMLVRVEAKMAEQWATMASLPEPWNPIHPPVRRSKGNR